MINKRLARPERRGELHATPSSRHSTKESKIMRKCIFTALIALVAVMAFSSSSAFAAGKCGEEVTSGVQQLGDIGHFGGGAKHQFEGLLHKAGFHGEDGTAQSFLKDRSVVVPLANQLTITDYGCNAGSIESVGSRTYAAGEMVVVTLPTNVNKAMVRTHRVKNAVHKRIRAFVIGRKHCANPLGPKSAFVWIWIVQVKHKVVVNHPTPAPAPTPSPATPGISIVNSPTFIQGQQQGQQQQQAQSVCISLGGTWNTTTQDCSITQQQAQCNANQVLIGGVCVNKTCEEMGTCQPPPPPCETCECLHNCKPPPCETCECEHNCKPPPCETCECEHNCKPPPSPPEIISVTLLNDVDAEGTSPNFCVKAEVPGSDTGTLVIAPRYGSFGPLGGTVSVTFTGTISKCATYYAPTEVPPGGHDKIKVTLRDNTTGLSAQPDEQEFRINEVPSNPS